MMNGILILCLCGLIPFFDGEQERAKKQKTTVATVARARMRAARTVREITQKGIQTCPRCDAFLDTSKEFRDYVETLFASCRKDDETALLVGVSEADTAEAEAAVAVVAEDVGAQAEETGVITAVNLTEYPASGEGTETLIATSESELGNLDVVTGVLAETTSETASDATQATSGDADEAYQAASVIGNAPENASSAEAYPTVVIVNGVGVADKTLGYEASCCFKDIAIAAEEAFEIIYDFRITDFQRHDDRTATLTVSVSNEQGIATFNIGTVLTLCAIHADQSRTPLATWYCSEDDLNTATFENVPLGEEKTQLLVVCASPPNSEAAAEDSATEAETETAADGSLPLIDSASGTTTSPVVSPETPPEADAEEDTPLINDASDDSPNIVTLPDDEDFWEEFVGTGDMPLLPGEVIVNDSIIAR